MRYLLSLLLLLPLALSASPLQAAPGVYSQARESTLCPWAKTSVSTADLEEAARVPWPAQKGTGLTPSHPLPDPSARPDTPQPPEEKAPTAAQLLGYEALALGWPMQGYGGEKPSDEQRELRQDAVRAFGESWVKAYELSYDPSREAGERLLRDFYAKAEDTSIYAAARRYGKAHGLGGVLIEPDVWEHASGLLRESCEERRQRLGEAKAALRELEGALLARIWGEGTPQGLASALRRRDTALDGLLGEDGQYHFRSAVLVPGRPVEVAVRPAGTAWQERLMQLDEAGAAALGGVQPHFAAFKGGEMPPCSELDGESLCALLHAAGAYALQRVEGDELPLWQHRLRELYGHLQALPAGQEVKDRLRLANRSCQESLRAREQAWKQDKRARAEAFWGAALRVGGIVLLAVAALVALFFTARAARFWNLVQWAVALALVLLVLSIMSRNGMRLDKGFSVFVQLGLTALGAWMTYAAARAKRHPLFILAPAIVVLLYQPLFDMKFSRQTLDVLDFGTAVALTACAWRRRPATGRVAASCPTVPGEAATAAPPAGMPPADLPPAPPCVQVQAVPQPPVAGKGLSSLFRRAGSLPAREKKPTVAHPGWWALGIGIWLVSAFIYVSLRLAAEEYVLVWEEFYASWPVLLQALGKGVWVASCFSLARALWRKESRPSP